jgi:hypothetical protein
MDRALSERGDVLMLVVFSTTSFVGIAGRFFRLIGS